MKNKITKIFIFLLVLAIIVTAVQGVYTNSFSIPIAPAGNHQINLTTIRGDSTYLWSDDFFTIEKIDNNLSSDYEIDTVNGILFMENTYPSWDLYPEWGKMKPLSITNSGDQTITDYVLELTIPYDTDMQIDFDDLRFADENSYPLTYWMGEMIPGDSVDILVRIPHLLAQQTTTIYMFYDNPSVDDLSDDSIFTWMEITDDDLRLSWTLQTEGAWDPHVAYGSETFITAWEEGAGPGYSPDQSHRLLPRQIHVRLLDINGENPIPEYPNDIDISTASSTYYHAENPSISYSEDSNKFLVVWEENSILYKYGVGIKAAFITPAGFDYYPFTICDPLYSGYQYYPCHSPSVAYDEQSNRFFVVWTKSDTNWDYDIYGKFYGSNGGQIGSQIHIASGTSYEGQPWVSSDNQGHFMVVYEDGNHPTNGPFSLKAKLYEYDGDQIGGTLEIATGTSTVDNIFPSVSFNEFSSEYLIVWNTGDVSSSDYDGNIKASHVNENGDILSVATVQSGSCYEIATPLPYLGDRFFITYDDEYASLNNIWGKLINSDGIVIDYRPELSDDIDFDKRYAHSAVGEGHICIAWEDERLDMYTPPTEIRASIWYAPQTTNVQNISYFFGAEEEIILDAVVVTTTIEPEDLVSWVEFTANTTHAPTTQIQFNILDINGTTLLEDISSGEDLTNLNDTAIRIQALFSRDTPKNTSILDSWSITATIGSDIEPPWTEMECDPSAPNGENDWYITAVQVTLTAYDNDSLPDNVTTYYIINNGDLQIYNETTPIMLSTESMNNSIEFWSVDTAGNEELPHNVFDNIKIDTTAPFVTIIKPPDLVYPGIIVINGTITEYSSGSGVNRIIIKLDDEIVYNTTVNGDHISWFHWEFSVDFGEIYDINVEAFDMAGLKGENGKTVVCSERGIYEPGYIYLFDNPKIGVLPLLIDLNLAITVDYDNLYIVLPEVHQNATSVRFNAKQLLLEQEFTTQDTILSDGCSCELNLQMFGFYKITASAYDDEDTLLEEYVIIPQMLVILLPT
jgi:hypothetical protein